MMLIDVKTKEELNIHMSQYGNHVIVVFGSKWALRNNYDNFYYLITYEKEHKKNTWNSSKLEPEVAISDEEAFSFIVKVRREESLNKILNDLEE